MLAKNAGVSVPADTELLFGETDESQSVRRSRADDAVRAVRPRARTSMPRSPWRRSTSTASGTRRIIHSRNVETITRMGREMDTTLFVQNGPSMAGLGLGGEGYLSFSIATPTGEGVTTPLTFTRQRRSTTVGSMRVV